MTQARCRLVSTETTPYYHCVSRCVRRAFLCGFDHYTQQSYEHRRVWVEKRLHKLAEVFAIDLCAYAVMSNHYHVVLRIDPERAKNWSTSEVVDQWAQLFQCPTIVLRYRAGADLSDLDNEWALSIIELWRRRLADLSWFMRCINEHIARIANVEDNCTGRFWEGRFKSQALLDAHAVLQCMAYVDLNPIRAGEATTPECSPFTSIHARVNGQPQSLLPFEDEVSNQAEPLPYDYVEYLQLIDWTGRLLRGGSQARIPDDALPILERLAVGTETWTRTTRHYGRWYFRVVGTAESMRQAARQLGQRWFKGPALN